MWLVVVAVVIAFKVSDGGCGCSFYLVVDVGGGVDGGGKDGLLGGGGGCCCIGGG